MTSHIIRQIQNIHNCKLLQITTQQLHVRTGFHFKPHNTFLAICSKNTSGNTLLRQNSKDLKWYFSSVLVSARLSESYRTKIACHTHMCAHTHMHTHFSLWLSPLGPQPIPYKKTTIYPSIYFIYLITICYKGSWEFRV